MDSLTYNDYFVPVALDDLVKTARDYKDRGYRLAQMHPVLQRDDKISLYYTFVKDNDVVNVRVSDIVKGKTEVPSLTNLFIAVFVFENEAHDLFGVNVVGNLLDFHGNFYAFGEGVEAPMTIVSPEQLAQREKEAKIARAKAAKAAKAKREAEEKAAAIEAARKEAVDQLATDVAEGAVVAPPTTAGAAIPAPKPATDPRYAGFNPETDTVRSQTVVQAEARLNNESGNDDVASSRIASATVDGSTAVVADENVVDPDGTVHVKTEEVNVTTANEPEGE